MTAIAAVRHEPEGVQFPESVAYARHLCRLCLCSREQTARQHLNRIEWFKWPSAEITRLYERVVGEQLPVSERVGELHCDSCYAWLHGTLRRIDEFKRISAWTERLMRADIAEDSRSDGGVSIDDEQIKTERIASMDDEERTLDNDGSISIQIEYQEDEADEQITEDRHLVNTNELVNIGDDEDENDDAHFEDYNYLNETEILYNSDDDNNNDSDPTAAITNHPNEQPPPSAIYYCDICNASANDKTELLHHFNTNHGHRININASTSSPTPPRFACNECPRRYRVEWQWRRHREQHRPNAADVDGGIVAPPVDRCHFCRKAFATITTTDTTVAASATTDSMRRAAQQQHYRDECPVLAARRQHKRPSPAHRREPLRCDVCPIECLRPHTLRRHYQKHHAAVADDWWPHVESRICQRCFRMFESADEAQRHRRDVHERWKCAICGLVCTCAQSLERHGRTHSARERKHRCTECERTYLTAHQLKIHYRRKHTDERPFACEAEGCTKRYAERSELNVHVQSAHSRTRYACRQCPGTYNSAKYLAQHVAREHTGDYAFFVCHLCERDGVHRQFVNTRLLNAHLAVNHADALEAGATLVAAATATKASGEAMDGAAHGFGVEEIGEEWADDCGDEM